MTQSYVFYFFVFVISSFWTILVIVTELISIFKNGFAYFKSPKSIKYPSCVNDEKYGQSKFIDVQTTKGVEMEKTNLKLHYVINGENNLVTMLFLHGFPEFWFSWRHQMLEFCQNYRVIALDMRGYGMSDKPSNVADYQMKHLTNDIKGLLDALNIRSAILLGHDWGGAVGWAFEKAFPEMVDKYISLNIAEPEAFRMVIRKNYKQFLKSWYIFFFQCPYLPEWKLSRFNMSFIPVTFNSKKVGLQKLKLTVDEVEAFKASISEKGSLTAAINYYRATLQFRHQPSTIHDKRTDKNRYMLIFGEDDKFIEKDCAVKTKEVVPNIDLQLLPGLSHWVQQDDPILVNELIRKFVETK